VQYGNIAQGRGREGNIAGGKVKYYFASRPHPHAIFAVVHERKRYFNWFIVMSTIFSTIFSSDKLKFVWCIYVSIVYIWLSNPWTADTMITKPSLIPRLFPSSLSQLGNLGIYYTMHTREYKVHRVVTKEAAGQLDEE